MKRLIISAAFAATLFAGAGTAFAAAPTPTPTPTPGMGTPSTPAPMPSTSISLDPNTVEVCDTSRETVNDGIKKFTTELENAGTLATNGDLVGAETSVKKAGTILLDLADQLRKDGANATNPELKTALDDVATELDTLGSSLNGLTSLQNFDTNRLETLANRVAELCGTN
jgi:hypothetical protein